MKKKKNYYILITYSTNMIHFIQNSQYHLKTVITSIVSVNDQLIRVIVRNTSFKKHLDFDARW